VLQEIDSHERSIRFLPVFQHAIQTPAIVEPTERPFHLPALATIPPVMPISGGPATRNRDMILAVGREGNNPALPQGATMRFTIVPFVQTQALGLSVAFADANTINWLQQLNEVISVGGTEREVERVAIGLDHQVPFQPVNAVFSRVANFFFCPVLAFTTLASW
jgi:hypothetical protein